MSLPMMQCGHAANSVHVNRATGERMPACVICAPSPFAYRPASQAPNLDGRLAECTCGRKVPSDPARLAFFEYRGPGSQHAEQACVRCHYHKVAHDEEEMERRNARDNEQRARLNKPALSRSQSRNLTVVEQGKCAGFQANPEGRATDLYYCGCRGWN